MSNVILKARTFYLSLATLAHAKLALFDLRDKRGRNLAGDRSAVTAMEYGLIAALIAVVIISSLTTLGTNLKAVFTNISSSL